MGQKNIQKNMLIIVLVVFLCFSLSSCLLLDALDQTDSHSSNQSNKLTSLLRVLVDDSVRSRLNELLRENDIKSRAEYDNEYFVSL